jgi:DUF1365 family protein
MDQRYEISVSEPGERLGVAIRSFEADREVFAASMALRRFELTPARMTGLLLRYPPMTLATLGRIYANALRLKLRGAQYHAHPSGRLSPGTRPSARHAAPPAAPSGPGP